MFVSCLVAAARVRELVQHICHSLQISDLLLYFYDLLAAYLSEQWPRLIAAVRDFEQVLGVLQGKTEFLNSFNERYRTDVGLGVLPESGRSIRRLNEALALIEADCLYVDPRSFGQRADGHLFGLSSLHDASIHSVPRYRVKLFFAEFREKSAPWKVYVSNSFYYAYAVFSGMANRIR